MFPLRLHHQTSLFSHLVCQLRLSQLNPCLVRGSNKSRSLNTHASSSYVQTQNETSQVKPDSESENESDGTTEHTSDDGGYSRTYQEEHYIPLTFLQKSVLVVGTGLSSFFDPTRAESIAVFGEVTAQPVLKNIMNMMLNDSEGAAILRDKPRINSRSIDLDWLVKLPPDTLGGHYIQFLRKNNVTPDSRLPVRFIADPELAYVMQRYREAHDLIHTVTGQPTNMLGEVVVKWIEGIQLGLPMCLTGGLFGATRLRPKQRAKYVGTHLNWALEVGFNSRPIINIYFEKRWEQPISEIREYISPLLNNPPT